MSGDYRKVKEELARGTAPELLCATCPWDRLCVTPPTMTREEIDREMAHAKAEDATRDPHGREMPVQMMVTALTYGGRDKMGVLCPVFALRLRGPDGRAVADGIRALMRGSQ